MSFVPPGKAGYDRAITVFSPDGKLFQVQYAQEAVKRGLTALGIQVEKGVVFGAELKPPTELAEEASVEKIFQIDEHIGVSASGLIADARVLVDRARIEAQVNRLRYDEPIPVQTLARSIGDLKQIYTQHAGVRPFGTRFLIGGVENSGSQLFETDPSGVVASYKAHAIGSGASDAIESLKDGYDVGMSLDDAILLALNTLKGLIEGELQPQKAEVASIDVEDKKFHKLSAEELSKYIKKLAP